MAKKWQLLHRTLQLRSPWVTVYADRLLDDKGNELEYWHYDRADSVVILAFQDGKLLLPESQYRVGVGKIMQDFAGGRIGAQGPEGTARLLLAKELGVADGDIIKLGPLTDEPLAVDSSFSSQHIYGMIAEINPAAALAPGITTYEPKQFKTLRQELRCAQCRLLLDEFLLR